MSSTKSIFKWTRNRYKSTSFLVLTVTLVIICLVQISYDNSYINIKFGQEEQPDDGDNYNVFGEQSLKSNGAEFTGEKLVHFDLKGAPPKISYLLNFLPFIKKLGATGILIEYEDTFPYHSGLEGITALNAYTRSDILAIVETARLNNLTVIPLIQTFGHFEFVLKLEKYKELREVEGDPQALCPSQENVYPLLHQMIDQIIEAHGTSKYLHIGCDEVKSIGVCQKCKKLMKRNKLRKDDVYFDHVKKIAEYINVTYPNIRPIMWSDKFVKQNEKTIIRNRIPDLVDVMFWNYRPERKYFPKKEDMSSYIKMFRNLWIANAFKGATGSNKMITNIHYHLKNTKGWLDFYDKWNSQLEFKGIALTGWQRYNHFMVLCELLPVGVPSLALNLLLLNKRKVKDYTEVQRSLDCNYDLPVTLLEMRNLDLLSRLTCDFPGFRIYHIIHSLYNTLIQINSALDKLRSEEMAFNNIVHDTSNPSYVQTLNKEGYKRHLKVLEELEKELKTALADVYDQNTINEWIMTHVTPVRLRLEAGVNMLESVSNKTVWPRRPQVTVNVKNVFNKICGKNETTGCTFFHMYKS